MYSATIFGPYFEGILILRALVFDSLASLAKTPLLSKTPFSIAQKNQSGSENSI
jgi:hypothetical protein